MPDGERTGQKQNASGRGEAKSHAGRLATGAREASEVRG